MDKVKNGRKCKDCLSEKENKFCNKCNKDTQTAIYITVSDTVNLTDVVKGKIKEVGRRPHIEFVSGNFPSGDKKFSKGVDISMTIDRKNDKYDQVVIDRQTGEKIHDHHEPLSVHRSKPKK